MKMKKKVLPWVSIVAASTAVVFFAAAPGLVENRLNRIDRAPTHPIADRARALHGRLPVADMHADSLLWGRDLAVRFNRGHVDIPRLIEGNVALQTFSVVTKTPRGRNIDSNEGDSDNILPLALIQGWPVASWRSLTRRALYQARRLEETAARSAGRLTLIRSRADLAAYMARRAREPRITAGLLAIEGAHALGGSLANIDVLFDAGFRMMSPTHFADNEWGGSAAGVDRHGLTTAGREMIRRMEAKGMIVDLAHAAPRTIDDVLQMATRPTVVSHTGVLGTCANNRNISDDHIRKIAARGGLVGIGFFVAATCDPGIPGIVGALLHTVRVAGVDHVALGSDFDGAIAAPFDATGLVRITAALMEQGFDEDQIGKIMGRNFLRYLQDNLPRE